MPAEHASGDDGQTDTIAVVTVTYNPDIGILRSQLAQLPCDSPRMLVDNGSNPAVVQEIRELAEAMSGTSLIENEVNVGLASALNQGAVAAQARWPHCDMLLFLDQDTEPGPDGVRALRSAYDALVRIHPALGCVGPELLDIDTGLEHGFHQISGWKWVRRFPKDGVPIRVANLNGSGTLAPVWLFNKVGGFAGQLFIDHVDTDWAFRVQDAGHELFGIPTVQFAHRMGVGGIRFWLFGWRVWPYRSPLRHFYLFRNTVRLLRARGVPVVWKAWAPVKLGITLVVHLVFDGARFQQVRQMTRGILAGLREWDRQAR